MANDSNVVTRGTTERTTVTVLVFDVGEDGTFGDRVEGEHVADGERSVLSGVDELGSMSVCCSPAPGAKKDPKTDLASVHALVRDERLGVVLELVGVAERDPGKRSTCSKMVNGSSQSTHPQAGYSPRPESWTISFTTPRMYPLRSACAR